MTVLAFFLGALAWHGIISFAAYRHTRPKTTLTDPTPPTFTAHNVQGGVVILPKTRSQRIAEDIKRKNDENGVDTPLKDLET